MGKKILVGITILLIASLFAGWFIFTRESKFLGTSAFKAIPENGAIIVRIDNLRNYTLGSLNNPIWKTFSKFPGIEDFYHKLSFADSLLKVSESQNNSLTDKGLTTVINEKDDQFFWLSIVELGSLSEKSALVALTGKYFSTKGASSVKIRFGEAEITSFSWHETKTLNVYYLSFFHGLFIGSNDLKFLEQSLSRLENPSLPENPVFGKTYKSAENNSDARIFLNHKKLPQFAKKLFSNVFQDRFKGAVPLAEWSEIDLTQKADELIMNGFSFTNDSLNNYLGLFLHQQPDSFGLAHVIPAETSFFLSYVINDNIRFFRDYEHLLASENCLGDHQKSLSEIDSVYGVNLQKIMTDHLDGSAALVLTRPDKDIPIANKYLVIRVNSASQVEDAFAPLAIQIPGLRKRDKPKNYTEYKIDQETSFKIYQAPVNDLGKRVFGEIFADVVTNYYTFYDNCLILGPTFESLGRFLRANILHETLTNDKIYRKFSMGLSDKLNIYIWCSPGKSIPFFKDMIEDDTYSSVQKKQKILMTIESLGWQITNEHGMIYNMARLKFNPDVKENPASLLWKSHLGGPVITKPLIVTSSSKKSNPGILVQVGDLNLLRTTPDGREVWKIKLKSAITSEIFQLDSKKNGQIQYFFSTTDALHLVSQEGKYLPNFPVRLQSSATNGVSVADYDHTMDYRFFVACKDHKVYLYDKKGKIVTGWNPPKSEHTVPMPVQFFRIENKDYIVFADKNRLYMLDRKGKPIVNIKANYTFSKNGFTLVPKSGKSRASLISTDSKGVIITVGFDGTIKKQTAGNFSVDHHFICEKSESDDKRLAIILDGDSLIAFDRQSKRIFAHKFNHPIGFPPQIFTFPDKSLKIGVADAVENKIYLFNSDGTTRDGFPLEGNSPFSLTFNGNNNDSFSLVTGTADGELFNYEVK